jgi:hypothetical protein
MLSLRDLFINGVLNVFYIVLTTSPDNGEKDGDVLALSCDCMQHNSWQASLHKTSFASDNWMCLLFVSMAWKLTNRLSTFILKVLQTRGGTKCARYSITIFSIMYPQIPKHSTNSATVARARTRITLWQGFSKLWQTLASSRKFTSSSPREDIRLSLAAGISDLLKESW